MAAIETAALTKQFGDVTAVDGLDLEVREGEIFGFLGPNGAGKSTTINLLLGFTAPTDGRAEVLGRDASTESRAIRERVGVLPEGTEMYERLTGREHVEYAIETKGVDDDPDAVLERVGLDPDDARRPAGGYSKGMTQRLGLGMALVGDPDLLILDEPSSGLDPTGIQEMRDIIRAEAADGTTVFFSSHILPEVQAVCDRVGIMSDGSLAAVDTIEGLREQAGSSGRLVLELDAVPADLVDGVTALDGVAAASVEDTTLRVDCTDSRHKVTVIRHVDDRTAVLDVHAEDASLEDLFNDLTTAEETGSDPEPAAATAGVTR